MTENIKPINDIDGTNTNKNFNNKSSKATNRSSESSEEPTQQQALNNPQRCDEAVGVGVVSAQALGPDASNDESRKDDKSHAGMPSLQTNSKLYQNMKQNQRLNLN